MNAFKIGDRVLVTPKEEDNFFHEFEGRIDRMREESLIVVDQEDDAFCVDFDQVKHVED